MGALEDIVDRAIDYTNRVLHALPSYRATAIASLRRLREDLVRQAPDDPAVRRLEAYLETVSDGS